MMQNRLHTHTHEGCELGITFYGNESVENLDDSTTAGMIQFLMLF